MNVKLVNQNSGGLIIGRYILVKFREDLDDRKNFPQGQMCV